MGRILNQLKDDIARLTRATYTNISKNEHSNGEIMTLVNELRTTISQVDQTMISQQKTINTLIDAVIAQQDTLENLVELSQDQSSHKSSLLVRRTTTSRTQGKKITSRSSKTLVRRPSAERKAVNLKRLQVNPVSNAEFESMKRDLQQLPRNLLTNSDDESDDMSSVDSDDLSLLGSDLDMGSSDTELTDSAPLPPPKGSPSSSSSSSSKGKRQTKPRTKPRATIPKLSPSVTKSTQTAATKKRTASVGQLREALSRYTTSERVLNEEDPAKLQLSIDFHKLQPKIRHYKPKPMNIQHLLTIWFEGANRNGERKNAIPSIVELLDSKPGWVSRNTRFLDDFTLIIKLYEKVKAKIGNRKDTTDLIAKYMKLEKLNLSGLKVKINKSIESRTTRGKLAPKDEELLNDRKVALIRDMVLKHRN